MATLCHFPTVISLSSPHNSLHKPQRHQRCDLYSNLQLYPSQKRFSVCACSIKKPRVRRKVKSNAELCSEIKEFVAAVGLPEGHVPSMKDLSQHGRSDLANIVRRRGYKVIRELLANSADGEGKELDANNEDTLTGQDEGANQTVEAAASTEVVFSESFSGTPDVYVDNSNGQSSCGSVELSTSLVFDEDNSFILAENSQEVEGAYSDHLSSQAFVMESNRLTLSTVSEISSQSQRSSRIEFPSNLSHSEETSNNSYAHDDSISAADQRDFLSAEAPITKSDSSDSNTDPDVLSVDNSTLHESSIDLAIEEEGSYDIKMPDEEIKNNVESYFQSAEFSSQDPHSTSPGMAEESDLNDISMMMKSSPDSTLKEKVTDFIRNGNLDTFEDDAYGILYEGAAKESKTEHCNMEEYQSNSSGESHPEDMHSGSSSTTTYDGNSLPSKLVADSAMINHSDRDNQESVEGTSSGDVYVDSDSETMKRHNQAEIDRLKFMLHQKELELSRLKEQIEKEKVALSTLQTKAESEISKAQKLISEKDAELNVAEESLSGLKEVEVEYSGNGEIVELAGSFNGWHHPIKMDPDLSSDVAEHIESRKNRVWSTRLWLYPGMYEIKFIVDGHWVLDPQRESIAKGAICNNILRIDR